VFTTQHKTVVVSVINDLATDQRVQRTCSVLKECGYEVLLIGRQLKNSPPIDHLPYKTKRIRLLFVKGPLFYFFFNLRLFGILLFAKCDLLFSNDLDTLWPNYVVSRIKGIPLIYDSHEIFCEVPELKNSPLKKSLWEKLERYIVPKLNYCITVNKSIAGYFSEKYKTHFSVVRNIPQPTASFKLKSRADLDLPMNKKIAIFQGAGINIHRGAEELVEAMQYTPNVYLLIVGGGDVFPIIKQLTSQFNLEKKIRILDKLPKEELLHYTFNADLGISIDKDTNLNYRFSLPNKLFDYIQAGLPVMASPLPEIKYIITRYDIGDFIDTHAPEHIGQKMEEMLSSPHYKTWKQNTRMAADGNTWETEKLKLIDLVKSIK
jgi:glycosyltransferase involved in cell wall biosynthesis